MKPPPAWTTKISHGAPSFDRRRLEPICSFNRYEILTYHPISSSTVISSDEGNGLNVLSDDSDDSVTVAKNKNGKRPKTHKRQKSRSPTPPEPLPAHIRRDASNIARRLVREMDPTSDETPLIRHKQPAVVDIAGSSEDDDFAAITARVKAQYQPQAKPSTSSSTGASGSSSISIKMVVKWVPHPFDEFAQEEPPEIWEYSVEKAGSPKSF